MRVAGVRRKLWWLQGALVAFAIVAVLASPYVYDRYFRVLQLEPAAVVDDAIPAAGSVPESFAPEQVVFCSIGESDVANGSITVLEEHRAGNLVATLDALAAPSRPQSWFSDCTVSAAPPPLVWLVDKDGRAVRPRLPLEPECGLIDYAPIRAIQELTLVTSVQHDL